MAKPRADLGAMMVSKGTAAQAAPHQPLPEPAKAPAAAPRSRETKALTVKLDGELYQRLRMLVRQREDSTGQRVSHQDVMVEGLLAILEREGQ